MYSDYSPLMSVNIPLSLYTQLVSVSLDHGADTSVSKVVEVAIGEWLRRGHAEIFTSTLKPGYQWKTLFLPHGTVLRTAFRGKNFHCHVDHDKIIFNDAVTSPSEFANSVGGVNRNAWKSIWLLFPDSTLWESAESRRVLGGRKTRRS